METITFTCKTITPLVMNGPYGDFPELRPPGIKASLRFWWRALHGHLSLDQLREQEGTLFGNTKKRSKVVIRVKEPIPIQINEKTFLLPHKTDRPSPTPAFVPNLEFKIRIDCLPGQKEMIKSLFIIACTLGGWGKRSRRGFGSVVISKINGVDYSSPISLQEVWALLEHVVPGQHRISGNQIESTHVSEFSRDEYPKLWKIEIGREHKSLKAIGQATHDTKFIDDTSPYKQDYSNSLGDGPKRYASPVYVSLLSNGMPVVSTLKKQRRVNVDLQNRLKAKIL